MGKMTSSASLYKDHLQAIGLITVNFAMLESVIASCAWSLLELNQVRGQIVTAELSFKGLVALYSSLYRDRPNDPNKMEELDRLIKRITQPEANRNVIAHSLWMMGDSEKTITRTKTTAKISKGLKHQFEQVTVDDLNRIADEIADIAADFQLFCFSDL